MITTYFNHGNQQSIVFVNIYKMAKFLLPPRQIKYPVDFDGELKIGEVRYDNMI